MLVPLTGMGQTLGTYPAATVVAGKNTPITPATAPTNATSAVAYTNSNFTGLITVNPATGVVTVTDAKPAGTYIITVKAFGAGSVITSFVLTVTSPACSAGTFTPATVPTISVGNRPFSVAIGDFNGDGKQDFATADFDVNSVSIRLGDGLGGFAGTTTIAVGNGPVSVSIGDFNGDGKQDFATANKDSDDVSIRLGDGLGGFTGTTTIAVGDAPRFVAIGDFNGDGKADLVTTNERSSNVSIRLGDGLGGFAGTTTIAVGSNPRSIAIGDFNGDGKPDFATANTGSNNVFVRLGDGLGGFTGTTTIAVGDEPFSIAIGDFNGDGKQDFATTDFGSNNVSVRLGDGLGGFSGTTTVAVGSDPYSVAIGDFNGDGKQDFVTTNSNGSSVFVRLGDGLGGFAGTTNIAVGSITVSVAIGDFNGDGRQDFATANFGSNSVSVLLGVVTDMTAAAASSAPTLCINTALTTITHATTLATGIANDGGAGANGLPAGVVANWAANVISINGTPTAAGTFAYSIALKGGCGNVNATGTITVTADMTAATASSAPTLSINTALTAITHATTFATGIANDGVAAANGLPAGVKAGWASNVITISGTPTQAGTFNYTIPLTGGCGNGNATGAITVTAPPTLGTYPAATIVAGKNAPVTPAAAPTNATSAVAYTTANFTGLLTVNPATGVVTVTGAKPAGTYTITVKAFGAGNAITTFPLTVTDPACSAGTFAPATAPTISVGDAPFSVAIGDFNGDGKQDFATANFFNDNVFVRLGDGLGGFTGTTTIAVGDGPVSVSVGDFNGDSKQDFATANYNANSVSIRLGDGLGGFTGTTTIAVGDESRSIAIGDFNGDGKQDFATANERSNDVSVRLGDGLGGFTGTTTIAVGDNPTCIAIGDFNGDGKPDFAAANSNGNNVSVRLGDGLGGFTGTTTIVVGTNPSSVAIGDFNGDGKQDFATANNDSGNASVRLGDGLGGFTGTTNISVGSRPFSIAIGDFNGDGKQDFAVANVDDNVSVRLGDGLGGFAGTTTIAVGDNPLSVAIGDFNGDGRQDFATANVNDNNVSVLLGVATDVTAAAASSAPTLCINTALTNITHATTFVTGIANDGVAGANGLPAGVAANWTANVISISGTPTQAGTSNYTIPLTGGCGNGNATGTITVSNKSFNTSSPAAFNTVFSCQGEVKKLGVHLVPTTGQTYQWQIKNGAAFQNLTNAAPYANVTGDSLVINPTGILLTNNQYRLLATNACGTNAVSDTLTLKVGQLPVLVNSPLTQQVCPGNQVRLTAGFTGSGFYYQWQINTGSGFGNVAGPDYTVVDNQLIISNFDQAKNNAQYRAIAKSTCFEVLSDAATITISDDIVILAQPSTQSSCEFGTAQFVAQAVKVTAGAINYQWQRKNGTAWIDINTGGNYSVDDSLLIIKNIPHSWDNTQFRCLMNSFCQTIPKTLTVTPVAHVTENPKNVEICQGNNALFSVTAAGQGLAYRWQENTGAGFTNLSNGGVYQGVTSANLRLSFPTSTLNGNQYRCIVSGTSTCDVKTDTSAVATISIGVAAEAQTVFYNSAITTDVGVTQAVGYILGINKIRQPNGKAEYRAGNSILLNPGFEVENGAVFKATIRNPCQSGPTTSSGEENKIPKEKIK